VRTFGFLIHSVLTKDIIEEVIRQRTCGAKNRRGEPCKISASTFRCKNGKYRCRFHGGLSTGPRTPEGKARCALNLPKRRARRERQTP
jgi:hypothetical protein